MEDALKITVRVAAILIIFFVLGLLAIRLESSQVVDWNEVILFVVLLWTAIFITHPGLQMDLFGLVKVKESLARIEKEVVALPEVIARAVADARASANAGAGAEAHNKIGLNITVQAPPTAAPPPAPVSSGVLDAVHL